MPRGGRRPGAGRKPKSVAELRLSGRRPRPTKRPRPDVVADPTLADLDSARPSAIPSGLLAGVGEAGRDFLFQKWAELLSSRAMIDVAALTLLKLAANLLDERSATRTGIEKAGTMLYAGSGRRYVNPACRHLRAIEAELIMVLERLRVEPEA
jgi:hypothetical protein